MVEYLAALAVLGLGLYILADSNYISWTGIERNHVPSTPIKPRGPVSLIMHYIDKKHPIRFKD